MRMHKSSTCTNVSPRRSQCTACGLFSGSALLLHAGEYFTEILKHLINTWKHSDMSEKIELQPQGDDTSRTEQDDATDDTQGTSPSTKAAAVTMSRWKKISFTVMTLLAYMFLNAGISMITPFYAIVVSFSV